MIKQRVYRELSALRLLQPLGTAEEGAFFSHRELSAFRLLQPLRLKKAQRRKLSIYSLFDHFCGSMRVRLYIITIIMSLTTVLKQIREYGLG